MEARDNVFFLHYKDVLRVLLQPAAMSTFKVLYTMRQDLITRIESVNKIQTKLPPKFWPTALLQERKLQLEEARGHCEHLCRYVEIEKEK